MALAKSMRKNYKFRAAVKEAMRLVDEEESEKLSTES